ncbi:MAG: hypothetical protein LBQ71_11365 [Hungatella sp.]|jgi:cyclic lactone autoinducer peptide|nr:hypothetical protein [Hungatella sp.]
MKWLERNLSEIVIRVAAYADGTSSLWGMYQPEEPHALLTELKQKRKSNTIES